MQITNKYNYPECVVKAVTERIHPPDSARLSVTHLVGPPAIRQYLITHWDMLTCDIDDELTALFGTAWHFYLSRFAAPKDISEQKLTLRVGDLTVVGIMDTLTNAGIIEDHKVTSAWSFVFDKTEWVQQLNTYALLAEENNYPIHGLTINAFLRDWTQQNAWKYDDYPKHRFFSVQIPLWSVEERKRFVLSRVEDHSHGLRECTPEERWQKDTTFAVMKEGRKTAMRVLNNQAEAMAWMKAQKSDKGLSIVERPGECTRCKLYCPVRSVCKYNQEIENAD